MAIAVAEKRKQPTKKRDDYEAPSRNGRIYHSRRLPGNNNKNRYPPVFEPNGSNGTQSNSGSNK